MFDEWTLPCHGAYTRMIPLWAQAQLFCGLAIGDWNPHTNGQFLSHTFLTHYPKMILRTNSKDNGLLYPSRICRQCSLVHLHSLFVYCSWHRSDLNTCDHMDLFYWIPILLLGIFWPVYWPLFCFSIASLFLLIYRYGTSYLVNYPR